MTRDTSINAYNAIINDGLLKKQQMSVYKAVFRLKNVTGHEVDEYMGTQDAHKRLSEIRDKGVIMENGQKLCRVTSRNVIAWAVTGDLPIITKQKEEMNDLREKEASLVQGLIKVRSKINKLEQMKSRQMGLWEN
jgi:hypothetical protein